MLKVTGSIHAAGKEKIDVLRVICRDDMETVRRPSDRDFNWRPPVQGKLPPVQVKEPYIR